jgi:hypothetical protein
MRLLRQQWFVFMMAPLVTGCGLLTGPEICHPHEVDLIIGVTEGTQPEFTWTPDCAVKSLGVIRPGRSYSEFTLWKVTRTGNNGIESGVRYGEALSGSDETCENPSREPYSWSGNQFVRCIDGPEPLIAGVECYIRACVKMKRISRFRTSSLSVPLKLSL